MRLSEGKSILLFRFHDKPDVARERLRILRHWNPGLEVHALFGGVPDAFDAAAAAVEDLVVSCWAYPEDKSAGWKWRNGDLLIKAWFRNVGREIKFDFLYSYDYDLLTLRPLSAIYPDIDHRTVALACCELLTEQRERTWPWTGSEPHRSRYLQFGRYLRERYGISRQRAVCRGMGPLLPREFLEAWAETDDIDLVHEEIRLPAFAEALGFATVDNGLHPVVPTGAGLEDCLDRCYFWSSGKSVALGLIRGQLLFANGRRAFHPVKEMMTLEDVTTVCD